LCWGVLDLLGVGLRWACTGLALLAVGLLAVGLRCLCWACAAA
jgi:hypothetical protein